MQKFRLKYFAVIKKFYRTNIGDPRLMVDFLDGIIEATYRFYTADSDGARGQFSDFIKRCVNFEK